MPKQVIGGNTTQHHYLARGFDIFCSKEGTTREGPAGADHWQSVVGAAHVGEPGLLFAPFQHFQALVLLDAGSHVLHAGHGADCVGVFPCQGGGRPQPCHRVAQALRRRRMVMYREGVVLLVHLNEAAQPGFIAINGVQRPAIGLGRGPIQLNLRWQQRAVVARADLARFGTRRRADDLALLMCADIACPLQVVACCHHDDVGAGGA